MDPCEEEPVVVMSVEGRHHHEGGESGRRKVDTKRKTLSLSERVNVIILVDSGRSCRSVAAELGVGRSQIMRIMKQKREILADFENNVPLSRKRRIRPTGNEEINDLCWKWFKDATSRHISVSGPMLKENALRFASELGKKDFKGSNGWLDSFVKRHNITLGKRAIKTPPELTTPIQNEFKNILPEVLNTYSPSDIYILDETGLLFRNCGNILYFVKGADWQGDKNPNDRVTVACCINFLGEKEKLLVIGKYKQPKCFVNIDPYTLPVMYRSNKKAWMTSEIFSEWLTNFNDKMNMADRQVVLFVDDVPSHTSLSLSNVILKFFSSKSISSSQPLDQGIFQSMKMGFRQRQLQHIIAKMDMDPSLDGAECIKQIPLLDAIYWLAKSWDKVQCTAHLKYLHNLHFMADILDSSFPDKEEVPAEMLNLSRELFHSDYHDLASIDSQLATTDPDVFNCDMNAHGILSERKSEDFSESDESENGETEKSVCSLDDMYRYLDKMKTFAISYGAPEILDAMQCVEEKLANMSMISKESEEENPK